MKNAVEGTIPVHGEMDMEKESHNTLPLRELVKKIGPGIVLAGVVIGPGAITTASMMGARYGYDLFWIFLPIAFMSVAFLLATNRIALLTGMPAIHAIRHYYGNIAAMVVGIATFLACVFFTIGNISGTGTGMALLFGIDWKIGATIMLVILIYCYFSKGVYGKIEKGITLCILGMIIAFYSTLIGTGGPSATAMGSSLIALNIPEGAAPLTLAFISTNASIMTGIYGTYLGVEKKWTKADLFNGVMKADAIAHIVGVIAISAAIVLVGAVVLHPQGISVTEPHQLAEMIEPIMGKWANIIMGVAFVGAGFSSLLGNTQRGVVLLNAGINKPVGLETKAVKWGSLVVIVFSALIAFFYKGSAVELIYIANVATAIATPVAGFFMCKLLWRKDINKGYGAPLKLQISMTLSYVFCVAITVYAIAVNVMK